MDETKRMQEKINELRSNLENVEPNDRIYEIEDYIREHEKSVEILAYFDTDPNNKSYIKYENVEEYFSLVDSIDEKIYLAQNLCDFELAEKLFEEYPFSKEQNEKFERLAQNNEDITKTLRPIILSSKYDFLESQIDFLAAEYGSVLQDKILGMDDKTLEIFKVLYNKVDKDTEDKISKIWYLTYNMAEHGELNQDLYDKIQDEGELTEDILNKILWLYTKGGIYTSQANEIIDRIQSIDDINNINFIIKEICDKYVEDERKSDNKNIEKIKESILMTTYGMTLDEAENLLWNYDLSGVEIKEDNKRQSLMYLTLSEIYNENNPDKLIAIYDNYTKENDISIDYLRTSVFNGELKELFAKEFNKAYTQLNELTRTNNEDEIPVYDAGTNFKICMTALGAYQNNFSSQENYFTYWNSKKIIAHTNSCSLIANNNLTTAKITNICLGFSNFDEEMFLGGSNKDMASDSQYHVIAPQLHSKLSAPEKLINSTRGEYNELVYERRDLGNGQYYKKNPDFIVFFEEFDDIENIDINNPEVKQILDDQKRKWQESLKAAKDFGVPIVKINRERCAISESEKIEENFQLYLQTHDSSLLSSIITDFENNRTGTRGHTYLTEKYFSSERIQNMLKQINESLSQLKTANQKKNNVEVLSKILQQEKKNADDCSTLEDHEKGISSISKLGIDVDEYLNDLNTVIQLDANDLVR